MYFFHVAREHYIVSCLYLEVLWWLENEMNTYVFFRFSVRAMLLVESWRWLIVKRTECLTIGNRYPTLYISQSPLNFLYSFTSKWSCIQLDMIFFSQTLQIYVTLRALYSKMLLFCDLAFHNLLTNFILLKKIIKLSRCKNIYV